MMRALRTQNPPELVITWYIEYTQKKFLPEQYNSLENCSGM